jgi:hypothetical protein
VTITKKSPWIRIATTAAAMVVVLLLAATIRYVQSRGFFASARDKTPGQCQPVGGLTAITAIAPLNGQAGQGALVAVRSGGLYLVGNGAATKLTGFSRDGYARALSLAFQRDHTAVLQAVMARAGGNDTGGTYYVSTYRLAEGKVQEIGRLTTDMLTDPAAIAAIDGERFYLVNRHGSHSGLGRWLDDTFLLPRAEILYFDGMKFIPVAKRLNSPTALVLSADGSRLFAGQDYSRNLASFSRSEFTGALDDPALSDLAASPQRITLAPDGSLIVTASPKAGAGAVYRLPVANGMPQNPQLLFATSSEEITAAAEAGGHLLIGSNKRLLDCKE